MARYPRAVLLGGAAPSALRFNRSYNHPASAILEMGDDHQTSAPAPGGNISHKYGNMGQ
jgi:hypothetical protein